MRTYVSHCECRPSGNPASRTVNIYIDGRAHYFVRMFSSLSPSTVLGLIVWSLTAFLQSPSGIPTKSSVFTAETGITLRLTALPTNCPAAFSLLSMNVIKTGTPFCCLKGSCYTLAV